MKKLLCLIVVSGCAAATKPQTLDEAVRGYNDGLRWERISSAAVQVPPKERVDFVDARDKLAENLKLTDWDVVSVKRDGETAADVRVKVTWYEDDRGVVHTTQSQQRWERHGKMWWIVDEHRLRGDEMPGLPEPAASPDDEVSSP
jgi:hypothetical protein